jgi:hypothetical protein
MDSYRSSANAEIRSVAGEMVPANQSASDRRTEGSQKCNGADLPHERWYASGGAAAAALGRAVLGTYYCATAPCGRSGTRPARPSEGP